MIAPRPSWQPPSDAAPDGTLIVTNRYEPVAEIGVGGMGAVVLARALSGPSAGVHVAMKRLLPHLAQEPEVLKAFLDEVYLISAMHHSYIVESIDWGKDQDGRFLVMQFVAGDSLRALVHARENEQKHLPIDVIAEIGACTALGLHAAHTLQAEGHVLGIVHQDVSPANILVGYDGTVKVIDFGVARIMSRKDEQDSQSIRGKFGYMSPEQLRGMPLDHRSDLFSLGVVLWEAVTLCRLYSGKDEFETARMVVSEAPVAPSSIRSDVPPELDQIILRCLAKDRGLRFDDAREVARALASLRPPRDQAPNLVAGVTRSSMPERLAWIEDVIGRPVVIIPRGPMSDEDMIDAPNIRGVEATGAYQWLAAEDSNDTEDGRSNVHDVDATPSAPMSMASLPYAQAISPNATLTAAAIVTPQEPMHAQPQGQMQAQMPVQMQGQEQNFQPYNTPQSSASTMDQVAFEDPSPSRTPLRIAAVAIVTVIATIAGYLLGSR